MQMIPYMENANKHIQCRFRVQDHHPEIRMFLYKGNEKEIKKTIPYTVASKRIKYLGDKLNEGGKRFVR